MQFFRHDPQMWTWKKLVGNTRSDNEWWWSERPARTAKALWIDWSSSPKTKVPPPKWRSRLSDKVSVCQMKGSSARWKFNLPGKDGLSFFINFWSPEGRVDLGMHVKRKELNPKSATRTVLVWDRSVNALIQKSDLQHGSVLRGLYDVMGLI